MPNGSKFCPEPLIEWWIYVSATGKPSLNFALLTPGPYCFAACILGRAHLLPTYLSARGAKEGLKSGGGMVLLFQWLWIITEHVGGMKCLLSVPGLPARHRVGGCKVPHVILVHSKVWDPLMQVAFSVTEETLRNMLHAGPGVWNDLAVATVAERERARVPVQGFLS